VDASVGSPVITAAAPQASNAAIEFNFTFGSFGGGEVLDSADYSTDNGSTWSALDVSGCAGTSLSACSATITEPSSSTTAFTYGATYVLRVRINGDLGGVGTSAARTVLFAGAPDAPAIHAASRVGGGIKVDFTPGATNGVSLTGYLYSTDGGATFRTTNCASPCTVSTLTLTVRSDDGSSFASDTPYVVTLKAVNTFGTSESSNQVSITAMPTADPPTITKVTASGMSLIVNATLGSLYGATPLRVEYSTDNGSTWRSSGQTTGVFTITGPSSDRNATLAPGTRYALRIRVVTPAGAGTPSATFNATPGRVPGPPAITGAVMTAAGIVVSVTAGSDNGSEIVRFEYSTDNGGSWWKVFTPTGGGGSTPPTTVAPGTTIPVPVTTPPSTGGGTSSLTFIITALSSDGATAIAANGRYVVRVRAVNAVGVGAPSAARAVSAARIPGAPVIKSVKVEDGAFALDVTLGSSGGATLLDVEYSTDNGRTWASTGQTSGSFLITNPSDDTESPLVAKRFYDIKVRAVTANGPGTPSVPVTRRAKGTRHTITFPAPGAKILGAKPFALNARTNSKLPVTVVSATPSVCTVSNSMQGAARAVVTLRGAGTCTLTATRGPSGAYPAAAPVTRSFAVTTAPTLTTTSPVTLRAAAAMAGLTTAAKATVTVKVLTPAVCAVTADGLSGVRAGECRARITVKPVKGGAVSRILRATVSG